MQETIDRLCREYTDLTEEEIQVIQMMGLTLQPMANLESADMFIDCPCREGDAIVVAEANPEDTPSSYKSSVVGMLAKGENEPAVARTFKLGIATKYMKARTQEDNYTIQSVEPIKYNGRVIGVLIRECKINEEAKELPQTRYQEALETPLNHMLSENDWLMESMDEGLILVDVNGIVSFRNLYAKELYLKLGYVDDILGQKYKNICLNHLDENNGLNEMISENQIGNNYVRVRQIHLDKGDIHLAVIVRDITWKREQEKSLVLKSVAIKELHHRVKNNLQTIASLLRLQARRTGNEETRKQLQESISRILSIAAAHQVLAQSVVDEVNLKEVLRTVKNNAVQPFLRPNLRVDLLMEGNDLMVDSDVATSAALAVNELLQNSMEYAFVGREKGTIRIILEKGAIYSTITVQDDGVGFDPKSPRTGSLGLTIVESMVRDKLHGNLKIWSDETGTRVTFDFMNRLADIVNL